MNRMSWWGAGVLVVLVFSLTACAVPPGQGQSTGAFTPYPPPGFTHEVSSSALDLFWNCSHSQPDTLVLKGLAFNPWTGSEIRNLQFALVAVDSRGATLAESTEESENPLLGTMRSTPFQLTLKTTGGEARYDLFYQYFYTEPGEGDGHEPTHSRLPGGGPPVRLVASGPILLAQATNKYLMIRDACSETQHRVR